MAFELTVLIENHPGGERLRGEHGLSLHLAGAFGQALFDTGRRGETLAHNAAAVGVDLASISTVILSHGHYDHAGGLALLARESKGATLYCHPEAFARRYVESPGKPIRPVGAPVGLEALESMGVRFVPVSAPTRVGEDVVLSGPIGGPHTPNESFAVKREDELVEDVFVDELFAMVRGQAGWVILSGCCHRGLANTLGLASYLAHAQPIAAVVGGLHLRGAGEDELGHAVELLDGLGRPALHAGHCTGESAMDYLAKHYKGDCSPIPAGTKLQF